MPSKSAPGADVGCRIIRFPRRPAPARGAPTWQADVWAVTEGLLWTVALVAAGGLALVALAYAFLAVIPVAVAVIAWAIARRPRRAECQAAPWAAPAGVRRGR